MNSDLLFFFAHQSHHATLHLSLFLLSIGLCSFSICCFLCTSLSRIIPKSAVRVLGATRIESPLQNGVMREKTNDGILISGDDKSDIASLKLILQSSFHMKDLGHCIFSWFGSYSGRYCHLSISIEIYIGLIDMVRMTDKDFCYSH